MKVVSTRYLIDDMVDTCELDPLTAREILHDLAEEELAPEIYS